MDRMEKFLAAALTIYFIATHLVLMGSFFMIGLRNIRSNELRYLPGESMGQRNAREYRLGQAVWANSPILRKVLITSVWLELLNWICFGIYLHVSNRHAH